MQTICKQGFDDKPGLFSGCWYDDDLEVHDLYLLIVTLDKKRYLQISAANIVVLMEPTAADDTFRQQIPCKRVLYVAYITCLFTSLHFSSTLSLPSNYYFLLY